MASALAHLTLTVLAVAAFGALLFVLLTHLLAAL